MAGTLFCFGYGYTASFLARRLVPKGWQVRGTTRNPRKLEAMRENGIEGFLVDREHPLTDPAAALHGVTDVLVSIPPDEAGDPVLDLHRDELDALSGLRWVGWLGTTARMLARNLQRQPNLGRARRRLDAERAWVESGLPAHIFRLAGIYGPGRNALDDLAAGTARRITRPGQVFSRIHVEDIAAVLEASMARPDAGRIYNVCDDEPAPAAEIVAFAAGLMGVEPPPEQPFETADLSPMARSFYSANRRVRNGRIKAELGVDLAYPTYREGLRALATARG